MARKKTKTPSEYYFSYVWPLCPNPNYPDNERPEHPYYGKSFQAQLLMWAVETNTMRIRLYDFDGNVVTGNIDAVADQWVAHLKSGTTPK